MPVALRPDGSIALAGYFNVSIDFEPPLLGDTDGSEDGFVAALEQK